MSPKEQSTESGLWKDYLDKKRVAAMAKVMAEVYPKFDQNGFVKTVISDGFLELELKDRIKRIGASLKDYLPADYKKATKVLIKAAPHLGSFANWSICTYVEDYGLNHFDDSVAAMEELTKHGTAEFAIRPYMINYTDKMLKVCERWAKDKNEHVRRLAAEGTRPRGVWVAYVDQFRKDPKPVIKLLDRLRADESLYVRKAVANNLNDISRDNPELAIATAERWSKDKNELTDWIIKRGLRTLIKNGEPRVLALLGFTANPKLKLTSPSVSPKTIKIGGTATIKFGIESKAAKSQRLVIDYRVHYVRANGRNSSKVFKHTECTLPAKKSIDLQIKQSFADLSTRKHHPGDHRVEILVNGQPLAEIIVRINR